MNDIKATVQNYRAGCVTKADYIDQMHEVHRRLFDYIDHLPHTDIGRIEITDEGIIMTTRDTGIRMFVDRHDKRIIPIEILNFNAHEREEIRVVRSLLRPNMTVLDIGANIGFHSLSMARMYSGLTIHAIEPIPKTFAYLKRNIGLNQTENIVPHNLGFSDRTDTEVFYYYAEGSGNASLANVSEKANIDELRCQVVRLDDFAEEHISSLDLIKCDVEGAELRVFSGGEETLSRYKPAVVVEMLRKWSAKFSYHPNDSISLFRDLGYVCFAINSGGLVRLERIEQDTVETNYVFLHSDMHIARIRELTD